MDGSNIAKVPTEVFWVFSSGLRVLFPVSAYNSLNL